MMPVCANAEIARERKDCKREAMTTRAKTNISELHRTPVRQTRWNQLIQNRCAGVAAQLFE